jgi:TusA-related sulfurtransferase
MSEMKNQENQVVVDARGFACPEPVMMARSALLRNKDKPVRVLVDTVTSKDNLMRLANREKRVAEALAEGDHWAVIFS